MRHRSTPTTPLGAAVALLLGVTLAVAGCGTDRAPRFTPVPGSDSAYCIAYRAWKVYEIDHGEAFDQPHPRALRRFWNAYLIAQETMLRDAPREIRGAVEIKLGFIRAQLTPLLERYGYDLVRLRGEGAARELALLHAPPAAIRRAQGTQYAYEEGACGMAPSPPPADVVFDADARSQAFCAAVGAFTEALDEVAAVGSIPV